MGQEYSDYSFYEMGKYDIPTLLDYIRTNTSETKVHYISHSMGTSQMFSALAKDEHNVKDKVSTFVAFSPVVKMEHNTAKFLLQLTKDM